MAKASPAIVAFSSGELSPLFDGRVDLEEYATGCRELENMFPLIQGPARRRGGTRFVREVKSSAVRCGFLRFEFNVTQAYVLEVGNLYMRFYTDHGIVMNGTNPLELATPWAGGDLFDADGNFLLRAVQSGDIMYITHTDGDYAPQKLTRSGALSWSIADFEPEGGPFEDIDPDQTVTVYCSHNEGNSRTLTASSGIFTADHVGSLFLLEQKKTDDVKAWEAGKAIAASPTQTRRVENRNYQALNAATTGGIVPSHTRGAAYDGDTGVQWQFLDAGYGWCEITAIGSGGLTATVNILSRIPDGAVGSGNASTRWAFGAWSDENGWPTHVTFFRERLTFLRATDRLFWMSVSGDYPNFRSRDDAGEVVADMAIRGEIASDRSSNRIEWAAPGNRLIVGTAGGEFAIGEITTSEPLGPGNCKAVPETAYGSKPVRPIKVGDAVLFVQRSGRKLRDLSFTIEKGETGGYASTNLSVLSPHLLPKLKAITALAYQQEPHSIVWALRSDGLLLATTLNANQRRFGWHRHPIGGDAVVEAIEVMPNPDGDADELWLIVKRTINGSTKRYVEYLEPEWERDEDIIEAFYVDSGLTYDGKVNATLTPGTGATVRDTEEVTFTAGSAVFVSGDDGKQIWYRYSVTPEDDEDDGYRTARAEITAVNSTTVVEATILSPWPSLTAIAANGWRKTVTSISGLDHLEGKTVDVLADGASHSQVVVASGAITLERPSTYVHVGLPCPCVVTPMRLEAGATDGTAQGKTKRIHKLTFRFQDTIGGKYGPYGGTLDTLETRRASSRMDEPPPAISRDETVRWPKGYDKDAYATYYNDQPFPATVVAIFPQVVTQDG